MEINLEKRFSRRIAHINCVLNCWAEKSVKSYSFLNFVLNFKAEKCVKTRLVPFVLNVLE